MALSPLGILSAAGAGASAGLGVAGYFAGGQNAGGASVTTQNKFAFPSETQSTTTALSSARQYLAGFADSSVAGYFAGGITTTNPLPPKKSNTGFCFFLNV
jgi:hypothetical protein